MLKLVAFFNCSYFPAENTPTQNRNFFYTKTLATMSEKPMNKILIIFLIIGFYSCGEKQKSEKKTETDLVEKSVSELKDFELLQDFEKNKAEFFAGFFFAIFF